MYPTLPCCCYILSLSPFLDCIENLDIDREELYKMFKAYFYLSMEAVREAVKVIEEELILNFHEDASNPVSSAFSGLLTQTGKNEMLLSQSQVSCVHMHLYLTNQFQEMRKPL